MKVTGLEVGIVAGRWRERRLDGGNQSHAGRDPGAKGELFAFLAVYASEPEATGPAASPSAGYPTTRELLDPSSEQLTGELRRRLLAAYHENPARSVTTCLGHAIRSLNDTLYAANQAHPSGVRRFAAASCLVVREGEVFIALAGPAVAHLAVGPDVDSFASPEGASAKTLGSAAEVNVELAHRTLAGPATVVLGATSLVDAVPETELADLLVLASGGDAAVVLRSALERRHASGLTAALIAIDGLGAGRRTRLAEAVTEPIPWPAGRIGGRPVGTADASDQASVESESVPPRAAARRSRRTPGRAGVPRAFLFAALVLAAAALIYFIPVRLFLDNQAVQAQQGLVLQAQAKEQEARAAADSASRLKLLVAASDLASGAAQGSREDPAVTELDKRLRNEIDTLTSAVRLPEPARLTSLDGQPSQLVLGASDLFVVDRSSDRVFRYPLEPNRLGVQSSSSPVVFQKGDKLGELVLGSPKQILWMPGGSGRNEGFLVIDSLGTLFEWDPVRAGVKIARPSTSDRDVPLIAGYAGTLYTLDATNDQLLWRPPSNGVYDLATYPYFQPDVDASVADVVSFAVAEDLYVLRKGGQIDRFTLGKPATFAGAPPDRPLGAGSSLIATTRGLYAFDPTNRRIVQFARDGTYRRQFILEGKDALVDVALDETRGLIYVLGPQGLFLYRSSDLSALPVVPTPAVTPLPTMTPVPTRMTTPTPTSAPARTPTVRTSTPPAATPTVKR